MGGTEMDVREWAENEIAEHKQVQLEKLFGELPLVKACELILAYEDVVEAAKGSCKHEPGGGLTYDACEKCDALREALARLEEVKKEVL